jgi:hypothetical protein
MSGSVNFTNTNTFITMSNNNYIGSMGSDNSNNLVIYNGSNIGAIATSRIQIGQVNSYVILQKKPGENSLQLLNSNGQITDIGGGGNGFSQWSNNSSNVFIFDSNVGIGISNPLYKLDVNGDGNFSSNLIVNGLSTFNSNVTINGILTVKNAIYTTSNIVIINNNQTIIQSNINIQSNLIVSQSTTLSNGLSNLGNAYFSSNLTVNSNLYVNANVNCSSKLIIGSNLSTSNSGFYWNTYAFKYSVPIGTFIINSNYDPGPNATTGCNNTPINGLVAYSIPDTTFPYQIITNNGFQAPVKGVYVFNVQLGITSRGFDGIQVILTNSPSNRGPLINRDTLSNIRAYSIATWESWANNFLGTAASSSDGYIFPSSVVANLNVIQVINSGDYVQCFAITHYGGRSNSGTSPLLVSSNTPLIIGLSSNNIISNSNPATAYNFFSGSLITNL